MHPHATSSMMQTSHQYGLLGLGHCEGWYNASQAFFNASCSMALCHLYKNPSSKIFLTVQRMKRKIGIRIRRKSNGVSGRNTQHHSMAVRIFPFWTTRRATFDLPLRDEELLAGMSFFRSLKVGETIGEWIVAKQRVNIVKCRHKRCNAVPFSHMPSHWDLGAPIHVESARHCHPDDLHPTTTCHQCEENERSFRLKTKMARRSGNLLWRLHFLSAFDAVFLPSNTTKLSHPLPW